MSEAQAEQIRLHILVNKYKMEIENEKRAAQMEIENEKRAAQMRQAEHEAVRREEEEYRKDQAAYAAWRKENQL